MKTPLNLGLKLFSSNFNYLKEAAKLYRLRYYSFIELYIVPGTFNKSIKEWEKVGVPYIIHAPHFAHGLNLSKREFFPQNKILLSETVKFTDVLGAKYIILHPGSGGECEETIGQINKLYDKRFLVENKPFIGLNEKRCIGASYQELGKIIRQCRTGFCLDVSHAIKNAFCNDLEPYDYLSKLISLRPKVVHVCDGDTNGCYDKHLNMGKGNFEWNKIFKALSESGNLGKLPITVETPKKSKKNLNDFIRDVKFIRNIRA